MKYLRLFENIIGSEELVPYQMYMCPTVIDQPICFVGNLETNNTSLLFIIFNDTRLDQSIGISSVRWVSSLKFEPLDISIIDYIIKNSIVNKTLSFIEHRIETLNRISGLQNVRSRKRFDSLYAKLTYDDEIKYYKELENNKDKFNL